MTARELMFIDVANSSLTIYGAVNVIDGYNFTILLEANIKILRSCEAIIMM